MFLREYDLSEIFLVLSLPGSSTGSVRFYFYVFFGIFPYFLLFSFSFTPFSTALPFAKLPVFYETDIFESNRNIFLFSSAHDIHSVLRLESAAMFKAKLRLSG